MLGDQEDQVDQEDQADSFHGTFVRFTSHVVWP